jgi:hypothetical protein
MIRSCFVFLLGGFLLISSNAESKTFKHTWLNLNYVPCDSMGITGSGTVDLTMNYTYYPAVVNGPTGSAPAMQFFGDFFLNTKYPHESEATGTLTYPLVNGGTGKIYLVKPWYPTIGEADSNLLVMPRVNSANRAFFPPEKQQAQVMPAGGQLKLNISIRFPQEGGNCFASFSQNFTLP